LLVQQKKLVVQKGNSDWDIDFQIILLSNVFSKVKAGELKPKILSFFQERLDKGEYSSGMSNSGIKINIFPREESGSASSDVATIRFENNDENKIEILRGKVNDEKSKDNFRWEIVTDREYYSKRKEIKDWVKFKEIFIDKKCENFNKIENKKKKLFLFI